MKLSCSSVFSWKRHPVTTTFNTIIVELRTFIYWKQNIIFWNSCHLMWKLHFLIMIFLMACRNFSRACQEFAFLVIIVIRMSSSLNHILLPTTSIRSWENRWFRIDDVSNSSINFHATFAHFWLIQNSCLKLALVIGILRLLVRKSSWQRCRHKEIRT